MTLPEVDVIVIVVGGHFSCGVLLSLEAGPELKDRILPMERRAWLAPTTRCCMRPSRAHLLLRVAQLHKLCEHAPCLLLDPCGGVGTLALEAAAMACIHCITMDIDEAATAEAAVNVAAAAGCLMGTAEARLGSAYQTGLGDESVDLVVADPPWGCKHKKMDLGRMLREMARVVKPAGTVLLIVSNWGGGVRKTERAISKNPFRPEGAWATLGQVWHNAGGMECMAFVLKLKPKGSLISPPEKT